MVDGDMLMDDDRGVFCLVVSFRFKMEVISNMFCIVWNEYEYWYLC